MRPFLRSLRHTSLLLGFKIIEQDVLQKRTCCYIVRNMVIYTRYKICKIDMQQILGLCGLVVGCKTLLTIQKNEVIIIISHSHIRRDLLLRN